MKWPRPPGGVMRPPSVVTPFSLVSLPDEEFPDHQLDVQPSLVHPFDDPEGFGDLDEGDLEDS